MSAGEQSLQFKPFANMTMEPRLTDSVATELRRACQSEGTFRLATHDNGDIEVSGVITRFHRHELSLSPSDTLTVRDYRLSINAKVTARQRSTGKAILSDRLVQGFTLIRVQSDLTSTERQAMPLLAHDLAKNIVALLADGSW